MKTFPWEHSEKESEKTILNWLQSKGIRAQKIHSGSIVISWTGSEDRRRVKLADQGTPDIICCIDWRFVWIEVKRDQDKVNERLKLYHRYEQGERPLPPSYERQQEQIKHKIEIEQNAWVHIITRGLWDLMMTLESIYPHRDRTWKPSDQVVVPKKSKMAR